MKNIVLTLLSLSVLATALYFKPVTNDEPHQSSVLSAESSVSSTPEPVAHKDPVLAAPALAASTFIFDGASWVYPLSTSVSSAEGSVSFVSQEAPVKIFLWYKDILKARGFSIKSAIQSQSNLRVLDKLAAQDSKISLHIEISKDTTTDPTVVSVIAEELPHN